MALTTNKDRAQRKDSNPAIRRQSRTPGFAVAVALGLLSGCVSSNESKSASETAPTIERLLTIPLEGTSGRDRVRSTMIRTYGIKDLDSKHIDNRPKTLADNHVLSMFWLEPAPADFMSIAVAAQPCFPVDRALHLTQASAHSKESTSGAQTYDAFRNGMMVSFSATPDGKCVSYIHIERDR